MEGGANKKGTWDVTQERVKGKSKWVLGEGLAISSKLEQEKRVKEGFPKGETELGGFRICLSVQRRELQFEIEIENWKSYMHRNLS